MLYYCFDDTLGLKALGNLIKGGDVRCGNDKWATSHKFVQFRVGYARENSFILYVIFSNSKHCFWSDSVVFRHSAVRLLGLNMWARSLAGINFVNANANVAVSFKYAPPFALTPDKQSETKTFTFVHLKVWKVVNGSHPFVSLNEQQGDQQSQSGFLVRR